MSSAPISTTEKPSMVAEDVWKEGSRRLETIWTEGIREL